MIERFGHDKIRLVECPACGTDLRGSVPAAHIAREHGPGDLGLTPLGECWDPKGMGSPLREKAGFGRKGSLEGERTPPPGGSDVSEEEGRYPNRGTEDPQQGGDGPAGKMGKDPHQAGGDPPDPTKQGGLL